MKLTPFGDSVVVNVDEPIKKIGSIMLPDTAPKKQLKGEVVAIGPGNRRADGKIYPIHDGELKVGDRVLFQKWAAGDTTPDEKDSRLKVLSEKEILARIDDE